jgi:hypothetical protein
VTEGQSAIGPAADLGAIRRCDEVMDQLAARRVPRACMLRDPAVAVLASLIADIDGAPARRRAGSRYGAAAAAAAAVAAALLAAAGFVVIVMLTCLGGARGRPARGWDGVRGWDTARGRGPRRR